MRGYQKEFEEKRKGDGGTLLRLRTRAMVSEMSLPRSPKAPPGAAVANSLWIPRLGRAG